MTKAPRKKSLQTGAKKGARPVTRRPAKADSFLARPRRQSAAIAEARDLATLVESVVAIIEKARSRVIRTVNSEMVLSYWHIGREIVEYVQRGEARAEYGKEVIERLSRELARKGQTFEPPSGLIKSPFILDLYGLSDHHAYRESDLETAILRKLSQFLLVLGKGFAFVARQKRIR